MFFLSIFFIVIFNKKQIEGITVSGYGCRGTTNEYCINNNCKKSNYRWFGIDGCRLISDMCVMPCKNSYCKKTSTTSKNKKGAYTTTTTCSFDE